MNTNKKLFLNMLLAQIGFILLIVVSYFTATTNIKNIMQKDINSIANSIEQMVNLFAEQNPKGYEDNAFKNAIKAISIGKTGYVYILDENATLIVHPKKEGKSLAGQSYADKIRTDKKGGLLSYTSVTTGQEKIVAYRYIPKWNMWIAPGVNKADYLDDVNNEFFIYIIGLGLIFMIIQAVISFIIIKNISSGIALYNSYFKEFLNFISLKQNKLAKVIPKENNEFAKMINQINNVSDDFDCRYKNDMKVIGEIVLTLDKVEQGIFKCRVKATTENPMISTLRKTINEMLETLENNMIELEKVTNAYANDDFKEKITISPRLKARLLSVMQGVNILGDSLSKSAKINLSNGQTLEANASTMKNSMHNLASKANEQAASLEETSAAVEEITSITRNNAQNASKMATLGQTVTTAVTDGQNLATKTAASMEEINTKVTSINEAITVIDQIAFQTNILSLNAAVEAATAGEAGKGFAVVAAEVRNLASRSAEAAKEIKDLVEDANSKANEGKKISDDMIKGYENLNLQIQETIQIIEDVSSSSKEQMTGIEQINDAITMLDRVTQENASESTQITNISSEVSKMAHNLVADAQSKQFN
ncbi:MAG: chemotaxis protein [Arcobacter sp.]|jgi:methyl-accepting chemotaxis protein|uniref:Methyl-accepting chemotaxis protein n=1 Tax=Poseidonibacter ostreae TaxID=2654171 RepID=A0ABQ6VM87_9BACT|nr:methyl-accepting chemotaxis protein [Poseidonibacter ostreae]KAB7886438.1 methyl-accepting chemotaxis protein [Poseidonibacter ostreae]KAB7891534.1 methyl-accepting chemotaxis protein [Poseidonibacter ostreae]MAC84465.1 chemotaxis protein [Arcobacter sp.]|tara:strand:+ start:1765 stop:3549 length:1785 start_codon:yes stop_codon:yes gene_type:complete